MTRNLTLVLLLSALVEAQPAQPPCPYVDVKNNHDDLPKALACEWLGLVKPNEFNFNSAKRALEAARLAINSAPISKVISDLSLGDPDHADLYNSEDAEPDFFKQSLLTANTKQGSDGKFAAPSRIMLLADLDKILDKIQRLFDGREKMKTINSYFGPAAGNDLSGLYEVLHDYPYDCPNDAKLQACQKTYLNDLETIRSAFVAAPADFKAAIAGRVSGKK